MEEGSNIVKGFIILVILLGSITLLKVISSMAGSGAADTLDTVMVDENNPEVRQKLDWAGYLSAYYSEMKRRHWTKENREMAVVQYNKDWYEEYGFQISNAWGAKHNVLTDGQINQIEKLITGIDMYDQAQEKRTGILHEDRYRIVYYAARACGNIAYAYGVDSSKYLVDPSESSDNMIDVLREGAAKNSVGGTPIIPNALDGPGFITWLFASQRMNILDPVYNQAGPKTGSFDVTIDSIINANTGGSTTDITSGTIYPGDLVLWHNGSEYDRIGVFVAYASSNEIYVIEEAPLGIDNQILFFEDDNSGTDINIKKVGCVVLAKHTLGEPDSPSKYIRPDCFNLGAYDIILTEKIKGDINDYEDPSYMQVEPIQVE